MHFSYPQQTPPCPHYDECGGCSLQHLDEQTYYSFKQNILQKAITSLGVDTAVAQPIIPVGRYSRRRAEIKVSVRKKMVQLGFYGAKSHDVFDLNVCLVCDDKITALIPQLKAGLQSLKKPGAIKAIALTVLDNGLDAIIIRQVPLHPSDKDSLVSFFQQQGIIRLGEKDADDYSPVYPLYTLDDPLVTFGKYSVKLPAGAFLQATETGQREITQLVTRYLKPCKKVADLYSGCGTYSFQLIENVPYVSAFEGSEDMVSAMHNAIKQHHLDSRMSATVRDIFKHPLDTETLNHFDGIVINPPRNGASPQIKQIGKSTVGTVVMVSCNPVTFARDAKHLLDCGYRMAEATAIDQFYWNKHLEIVALFVRD